MRVVLDSNILLGALISPHAPPHRIYQAWRKGRFELITSTVQRDELRRASRYPKLREGRPTAWPPSWRGWYHGGRLRNPIRSGTRASSR